MIRDLQNKVKLMLARGVIKLINDSAKLQEVQVQLLADEVRGRGEHFQHYGFTSRAFPGAECLAMFPGGNRSHPLIFCVDDRRYRKKDLAEGEVALYTDQGDYIWFKRDGHIEIKASADVKVISPNVLLTGNLHVDGSITCDGNVSDTNGSMQEMRDDYNDHGHPPDVSAPPDPEMS